MSIAARASIDMGPPDNQPPFAKITEDVLRCILKRIPSDEIVKLTRVCKEWDSTIRSCITAVKTCGLVLKRRTVSGFFLFLAKTTSVTCLDIEVAGAVLHEIPSIIRLPSVSQLEELTLSTGTHSMHAFRDFVESLSSLRSLQTLRIFTYRLAGRLTARLPPPRDPIRCKDLVLKILRGPHHGGGSQEFLSTFEFKSFFVGVSTAAVIVPFRTVDISSETLMDLEIGPGVQGAQGNLHLTTPALRTLSLLGTTTRRTLDFFSDCSLQLLECHFGVRISVYASGQIRVANLALHAFFPPPWDVPVVLPLEELGVENILLRGTNPALGVVLGRSVTSLISVRFESDILLRLLMEDGPISFEDGLLASPLILINAFGISNIERIKTLIERCPGIVEVVACGKTSDQMDLWQALAEVLPHSSIKRCCEDSSFRLCWRGTTNWSY